jgi:hypothetical protein
MTSQQDDQAKALRQRFEKSAQDIGETWTDSYSEADRQDEVTDDTHQEEIDVLSLPPRSRLHEEKTQKVRLKISYAMIRLMVISFILLVILLLTYPYWKDTFFTGSNQEVISAQLLDHSSEKHDDARFRLSNEFERTVELETGKTETYQGRLYISLEGETLIQIVDRFYDNQLMLNQVQTINAVSTRTEILPAGTRLFLPDVKK